VDASSSAALAAYINSLTYELDANTAWFSSKGHYKLKSGTYCCFNAFSRVDVRVEVSIPGSVDSYIVDLRGERHPNPSPEIWQEVYLSALLRSILYADDPNYRLAGYRKLDPIASLEAEHRFLQAAENLFFKGWQLGSDPSAIISATAY
jgi:Chs5-Arf1p-binding protein BUD7/BCH1